MADSNDNLRRNSAWMMGGQFFAIAFKALYFVLIGRAIGSSGYGEFVGVASFLSVLSQFSTMGMDIVLIRDVSRDRSRFASSWGLSLEIAILGFCTISAIALLLGRFFLRGEVYWLIPGIAVSDCLLGNITMLASRAFQSVGKFSYSAKVMAMTNVTRTITAGCLYLYVLHQHRLATANMWTNIYWLSSLVATIIALWLVTWQIGAPRWTRIHFHGLLEGLGYSVSSSSISIYNDIDKTMLVSMGQTHAAGIYSAAYRIVDVATSPMYSIYAAAFPSFFREGAKSIRSAMHLALRLLRKTAAISVVSAVAMFAAASLLPMILGPSFAESSVALRWLCLLPLIRCFHYAAGTTITGSVSQWYRTAQQITAALLNLALNWVLIPRFSWQGAAAASLLSDGALAAMNWLAVFWLMRRQEMMRDAIS